MSPRQTKKIKAVSQHAKKGPQSFWSESFLLLLCYITIVGWFVAYISLAKKRKSKELFHLRQSFGLHMTLFAAEIGAFFDMVPYFIVQFLWIGYVIVCIILCVQTARGKQTLIPFVGNAYQRWFSFL